MIDEKKLLENLKEWKKKEIPDGWASPMTFNRQVIVCQTIDKMMEIVKKETAEKEEENGHTGICS